MKLRIFIQILLGLVIGWFAAASIDKENLNLVFIAIPLIGLAHEILHVIPLKLYKLKFNFVINGMLIGFKSTFKNIDQYIVIAVAPQIITITLAVLYTLTSNIITLVLSILHLAISCEDILRVFKYIANYFI